MNLKAPRFVAFLVLLGLLCSQFASAANMPMTMDVGNGLGTDSQSAGDTCGKVARIHTMQHGDSAMNNCCDIQHENCSSGCNCCISLIAILISPGIRSIDFTPVFPEPIEPQNHSVPPVQALYRPPIFLS